MKFYNIHWDDIEIDRRIIPLFKSNIEIKKKELLKKKNYDLNLVQPKKLKLINDVIPLNVKLLKIYNLINNYSLTVNNLYLKNDILRVLPSEDKFNLKISLKNIVLKLKLFEPIFSFNNFNYSDYLYYVLGNKNEKISQKKKKLKIKTKKENEKALAFYKFKHVYKKNNLYNINLLKSNPLNKNIVKSSNKNFFQSKPNLDLRNLKLSLFILNKKKNNNRLSLINNVLNDEKKINKINIKKIKNIFIHLQTQKKKNNILKNLKKKNMSVKFLNFYTNIFQNYFFADKFSKKRLGPKPQKINKVWYSKLYEHSLITPSDVSNFFHHRNIENEIAKKNPNSHFWFNHTFENNKNQIKFLNKFVNLRNTYTKTSYRTISKKLNHKVKTTLFKLNSLNFKNNLKNKNMINKFYLFKNLNNNKKYFLWNFIYKNSLISKYVNKNKNYKNNDKAFLTKFFNNNNNLDFILKWNNLNLITRLIILWELKKNSHFIQLFNYFNKKKVNKDIFINFNNFFYKYLFINNDKNKFFEDIKLNKINKNYSNLLFEPILNNKNLKPQSLSKNVFTIKNRNNKDNNIKFIYSNKKNLNYFMLYSYPQLYKIRHKILKYRIFYLKNIKKLKKDVYKIAQKENKKLIFIKKATLLNKNKNKNNKWLNEAYEKKWINKYKRFNNKKKIKAINNILAGNLNFKYLNNKIKPHENLNKKVLQIKINDSKNKLITFKNKNLFFTFKDYFNMLRKTFFYKTQISSKHIVKIKPRINFSKGISKKYALSIFKILKKNNFDNSNLNKRINFKINNLKFNIFRNKKINFMINSQKNNNNYNFNKHILNVVKGVDYNVNNKFYKNKINNNDQAYENHINYNNNLIQPFEAKNFVDLIKNKNNKIIIKDMMEILNNIENEINIINLKKREKSLKIKMDGLKNKIRKKIFILTVIKLLKKIDFFKFIKEDDKLIYPANTLYMLYFKKEFELMLFNFIKAGVIISEFDLPNEIYNDLAFKYNYHPSLPNFYLNNLKFKNELNNNQLQNKYFEAVYGENFSKNVIINKKSLTNNFIFQHPILISKAKKIDKVMVKIKKQINYNAINSLVFDKKFGRSKYRFFMRKKKKFRRYKVRKKLFWKIKINKLKKKIIYIKNLNNYKFVVMKKKLNKEQLFRKLYILKKRIKLKKIIINKNLNKIKKTHVLRKYSTPIKGNKEENNFFINSNKENKINMVKWIKWRIFKIKKFDWKVSTVFNNSPVDIVYFNNNNKNLNKNLNLNNEKEQPIIHSYLKNMSIFNRIFKGSFVYFNKFVGFNFNHANNYNNVLGDNMFKFLFYTFKKMFSLISKPIFVFTPDKVVIHLFYYILLPTLLKKKIYFKNFKIRKMAKIKKQILNFKTPNKYHSNKILIKNHENIENIKKNKNLDLNKNNLSRKNKNISKVMKRNKWKRGNKKRFLTFKIKKKINLFKKIHAMNRIKLKYLSEISLIKMYPKKFEKLCNVLSKFLKKKVELNIIRLHYPYKDSHILANYLQLLVNKLKFVLLTRRIFTHAIIKKLSKLFIRKKYNLIPSYLTGLKFKVAGRLMKYKVIPRKTVQIKQRGSSSIGTVNYTSFSRVTAKNRRGAYSITVSSGQNFF